MRSLIPLISPFLALSLAGCLDGEPGVDAANPQKPASGLIPYEPHSPLWSDGADKERALVLPPDGTLGYREAGTWELPSGAVLINYTIADGHGGTATASVTVNVGTNTPPQGADATVSVVEDGSRVFAPSDFGFTDADAGQSLAAVRRSIDTLLSPDAGNVNGAVVSSDGGWKAF